MAIPQKIIDLATLALQDRVLTFKERETIVAEALKMGVNRVEINAYLTNALDKRLQSYTKEELGSCPGCGHGVPLIADQCPYCGTMLQRGGSHVIVPPPYPSSFNVSDEAAQIIQQENYNTEQEKHENCPKCGAPYPLVSNICGHCGYVLHERRDSDFNINTLMDNMRTSIANMKKTLRPSFLSVLKSQIGTLCLFFAAAFFIIGELFDNDEMTAGGCCALPLAIILLSAFNRGEEESVDTSGGPIGCLAGWGVWLLFGCKATKTAIDEADDQYFKALHSLEQYQRQIDTIYGNDAEARRLLDDYAVEIGGYKKMRNQSRNMIAVLFVAVMAIPFVVMKIINPQTVAEKYVANQSQYTEVYKAADFSKEIPCKMYMDNALYFDVVDNVDVRFGVLTEKYLVEPRDKSVKYQIRISGVHLRATGKILEHPESCVLQGALMSEDGNFVGQEFYPFRTFITNSDYNYRTVVGKGKGDVYVEFYAKGSSPSALRLKEVVDSTSYFLIF